MADSDDEIYVDVVPKLDEGAADEAVGRLRDKFSHAGDSIKDTFHDMFGSLSHSFDGLGGKLKDSITDALGDPNDLLGGGLGRELGTSLGRGMGTALNDALKGNFGNILGDFGREMGSVTSGLDKLLAKLSGPLDNLSKAGGGLGQVASGNLGGINDAIEGARGLGVHIPGPINNIQHVNDIVNKMNEHPGQTEDWLSSHIPGLGVISNVLNAPGDFGTWLHNQAVGPRPQTFSDDRTLEDAFAKTNPGFEAGGIGRAGSLSSSVEASLMNVDAGTVNVSGSISGIPGLGDLLGGRSGSAGASHSAASLGGAGSSLGLPTGPPSHSGGSLGGAGSFSGLGFDQGGMIPGDSPGYDNILGSSGGRPIGLEGGEFIVNPQATQDNLGLLKALNSGSHFDGGGQPPFDPQNPTQGMPPTQGNQGGPMSQPQIGSGQGAGISGGGIIGAAEQAGVMAAGVAGFGGGAVAAQIAEQEINLAVQKSSQLAYAAMAAPLETLWLQGGQMGAPSVSSPMFGWPGKLLGGLIGSQYSQPNIAGAVQPPKQPQQQQDQKQQDPANGDKAQSPSGHADDPMHVNVTNQPPGPKQGDLTSAMTTLPAATI